MLAAACSFCGKNEVAKLIAGPKVYICDECIDLCNDILTEEPEEPLESGDIITGKLEGPAKGVVTEPSRWFGYYFGSMVRSDSDEARLVAFTPRKSDITRVRTLLATSRTVQIASHGYAKAVAGESL